MQILTKTPKKYLHPSRLLAWLTMASMGVATMAITAPANAAGISVSTPTPFSTQTQSTLCYVFPTTGSASVNQVPCSYVTKEVTTRALPNYKTLCHDANADSGDLVKQTTLIQFTGYGLYEHNSNDIVCSGQGDGWVGGSKEIKVLNKKPAIIKYRHIGTGKVVPEKTFTTLYNDYMMRKMKDPKQAFNYSQCVTSKGLDVDLCLPVNSYPDFTAKK